MAKIMFLQQVWFPIGGVMSLSGELKKAGHETQVAVGNEKKVIKELIKYQPDIVAFSIITPYRKFMIEVSKKIKKLEINPLIVVGGYDASFFPEIIENSPIDILCRGEGDDAFVELANAIEKKQDYTKIKNLIIKKNKKIIKNELRPFKNLNKRAFYDRDIYRDYDSFFSDIEFEQVMVGGGCPYKCSYCFNHKYRQMYESVDKKYCGLRDVDNVIEELKILKNKYKIKVIFFNDSTLGFNKEWLREFVKKYKEKINLPFTINVTVNEVDDEFCKLIASTDKCFIIRIGLETGNEKFRAEVLNKPIPNKQYVKAINLFRKYKIRHSISIMLGLPGETLEYAFETLNFADKLSSRYSIIAVNIFKPFPRLDITFYGVKIGQYDKTLIDDSNLIGDNVMTFYDCFRTDSKGRKILNLSRLSHIYLNFPFTRNLIKKKFINIKDNFLYRFIWKYSEAFYTTRHHVHASWKYILKLIFKHKGKEMRG